MKQRISPNGLAALIALIFSLLVVVSGCNSTGLPQIPTAAPPTPTTVAELLHATATIELVPTPREAATSEPISTKQPGQSTTPRPIATDVGGTVLPTPTLLPEPERARIFQEVWDTVEKNYLYKDFHGADWQALHDQYLPKVTNAATSDDFYTAISDMVDTLKDDHSRYLSPQDAKEEDDLQSGNANYVGVGILSSPQDKTLMVIFVFPGSPAERAGLRRRDRITAVDGVPFQDPRNELRRIRGPKGSTVHLTITSPGQPSREVDIVRDTITGGIVPTASRLAANSSIGFLVVPDLWTDDMDARVHDELRSMLDDNRPLKGLIIDLRGNGGGFRTVLQGILGNFVTGEVGKFFNQKTEYPFTIQQSDLYERLKNIPLVVLVDGGSESYTEVLAATLQAKGRAKVVGVPSAGNTETIYRYDFEDNSRLWVAQESFKLPDGTNLEGKGVIPDAPVNQDWTAFSEDNDPDILKAIELLKK